MVTISVDELQRDVAGYLSRIGAGETVIITQADQPIAELKPLDTARGMPRPYALAAGEFVVPDDFNDPLPDALLDLFET